MSNKLNQRRGRIAILGCATPTLALAPFENPEWTILAGGQLQPAVLNWDEWFEIHNPDFLPAPFQKHLDWLAEQVKPVNIMRPTKFIPNGVVFPWEKYVKKYGKEFFTSTAAWMMAEAIERKPIEIGLYGIEMSTEGEYHFQRPGLRFFKWIAENLHGITVTIPPESDLCREKEPYPMCDETPFAKWVLQRSGLVQKQHDTMVEQRDMLQRKIDHYEGGLEIFDHLKRHEGWS